MLGAIVGDIIGSRFERINYQGLEHAHKSKEFDLYTNDSTFTDDTVCTCATAQALLKGYRGLSQTLDGVPPMAAWTWKLGRLYSDRGFGGQFTRWLEASGPRPPPPFQSWGNGSAMRVSPIGWWDQPLPELLELAQQSAMFTHDSTEGITGAKAVVHAIWLARHFNRPDTIVARSRIRDVICQEIEAVYYPGLAEWDIKEIRATYPFTTRCSETVPVAVQAFRTSDSFTECIRNAVSVGGDSDTLASIAGAIAHAFYGAIPDEILKPAIERLPPDLKQITQAFCSITKHSSDRHREAFTVDL